jgi:hypothetical protein
MLRLLALAQAATPPVTVGEKVPVSPAGLLAVEVKSKVSPCVAEKVTLVMVSVGLTPVH